MTGSRWVEWHDAYRDPESMLSARLAVVRRWIAMTLDAAPTGPIRVVSACAGEGRDLLDVLANHPRAADVRARLVELDPELAARARVAAAAAVGADVEVVEADAGCTDAYAGAVPADLVLLCGVFGNVDDADIARTVAAAPMLCAPGATLVWTRHRNAPDRTPDIRRWFVDAGFDEVAFEGESFGVGVARYAGDAVALEPGHRLFEFVPR